MVKRTVIYIFYDSAKKKILIENRSKEQFLAGEKVFPGGKVHEGEEKDFIRTLFREVKEELGVAIKEFIDLKKVVDGLGGYVLHPYLITSWEGKVPTKTLDKGAVLEWVAPNGFKPRLKTVRDILKIVKRYVAQSY